MRAEVSARQGVQRTGHGKCKVESKTVRKTDVAKRKVNSKTMRKCKNCKCKSR